MKREGDRRRDICELDYDADYEPRFHGYHDLMRFKIRDILLVSSLYDAFILEEDGRLSEQLFGEYQDLDLSSPPRVSRVSTANEALDELENRRYDMIITMTRLADLDPFEFGARAKGLQPDIPVVLLVTDTADLPHFHTPGEHQGVDKVFYWTGDSTLFLAITKYVEDRLNAHADIEKGQVRTILIIENSSRFYSMFLPIIYTEIMNQTSALVAKGLNEHEKLLRRRARPKIMLAETYDEAMDIYRRYKDSILGIITDVSYPMNGEESKEAGIRFIEAIDRDIPVLLQSSREEYRERAEKLGVPFINKGSETLLLDLRRFFTENLGFGDFIFKLPSGEELGRAADLKEFGRLAIKVPAESIKYHGNRNDFSNWLMARGEFDLAMDLRPLTVSDFKDDDDMRDFLIRSFKESRRKKQLGIITDFGQQDFEFEETFTRFGGGSLGGKGRGLAFLATLIHQSKINRSFPSCRIRVPDTFVIATEDFDKFMEGNQLNAERLSEMSDDEIKARFLDGELSQELTAALEEYLAHVSVPLAVRSSSLLEDSQNQPFAGIYSTYVLPNNSGDDGLRLKHLSEAIKLVYASAFYKAAKAYIQTTVHSQEEEKMAVVVQKLVGNRYGGHFYPFLSGIAQSHNYYPIAPLKREDGIASIALGLGKIVVDGGKVLSFSPRYPDRVVGFSSIEDTLRNSQKVFYSLSLSVDAIDLSKGEDETLEILDIEDAANDGSLELVASTYDVNDNRVRDSASGEGPKLITFSRILKYDSLPLADILQELLRIGERGMGTPVEIEFANSMDSGGKPVFYVLQIRPFITRREKREVSIDEDIPLEEALAYSDLALGNGIIENVRDVIYVPPETFDRSKTLDIAREIGELNRGMEERPYLLIGPGRWGSRDRWLGIPVEWDQISFVKAMVETSLEDFRIDPSHGTHFFHNITSRGIPYLTVKYGVKGAGVDWKWLAEQECEAVKTHVRHLRLPEELMIKVDGRSGRGVIMKKDGRFLEQNNGNQQE